MDKLVVIKFYEQASSVVAYLASRSTTSKPEASLLRAIDVKVGLLKANPFIGERIQKDRIPKEYKKQGITNLYRIELPGFWRMLYTINGNTVEIIAFILDIVNHKSYNKKFGYKH
jgi:hypothetical protein